MDKPRIIQADLDNPQHQVAVLEMTRSYARDPMGNGRDLSDHIQKILIQRLRAHPTTLIFVAFDQHQPIGIATCFIGFSTFAARPLLNIHDIHVVKAYQRCGVGRRLIGAVENKARKLGCCKLTLEVQERNLAAMGLYHHCGFISGQNMDEAGGVLFREKRL